MLSLGLQNCFSYLDFFANLFRFCYSWRQLLHLIFLGVRQRFGSRSIGMPRREFFSPRTTLTSGGFFSGTRHSCLSLLARLHQSSQRARSLGRWMVAPRSSIATFTGTSLSYFFSSFFPCLLNLLSNTSMHNRYIVFELIAKKALGFHVLPAYMQSYLDDSSEVFMYSAEHVSSFGAPHLRGGAWYLDCRLGFTPPGEEALFSSLSSIAPIEVVLEEEEAAQPAQVVKPKRVRGKKAKDGAASKPAAQSTALVVTRSAMKAAAEASAAHVSTAVGSPSALPSMVLAVASQSEATVPSIRKRKAVAPDASVTSSDAIPISVFIENADMKDLIKVYQVAKKHDPIYICIQEFLTRVSLILLSFSLFVSFFIVQVL